MRNLELTRHHLFTLPKQGNDPAENEDAAAVVITRTQIRAAVADGATEAIFSRHWAAFLVHAFVEAGPDGPPNRWLDQARTAFQRNIASHRASLPWYAAQKAEQGSFATFLGMTISASGGWQCVSTGDCCLFHFRNGSIVQSWPLDDPSSFDSRPALISSESLSPQFRQASGRWNPADTFVLATDAVAAWLLNQENPPHTAAALAAEIAKASARAEIRNDDLTCLHLSLAS